VCSAVSQESVTAVQLAFRPQISHGTTQPTLLLQLSRMKITSCRCELGYKASKRLIVMDSLSVTSFHVDASTADTASSRMEI
jgi:hypothetical protein